MDSLIPEADEEEVKTLIPEDDADEEDDGEDIPVRTAPRQKGRKRISAASQARLNAFIDRVSSGAAAAAPARKPKEPGLGGTIKEGAKSAARAIGATVDTYQGDEADVVAASKAQAEAPKNQKLQNFLNAIEEQKKNLGDDPSLWESIKAVGSAALEHPAGAGLMVAEQIPNSAVALGAGAAGAAAGSLLGPGGALVGGLAGLFGGNTALETGHKAMEAARDGAYTPEEQERVKREGAVKGGVITGVDALTLGMTKFITGTTRRAVEQATVKTLADNGVDVTNATARKAAMETPEIAAKVKTAQELAQKASDTLGKKIARTSGAVGLETIGEGAGEYLGEFAATGKADMVDAVVESLAGLSQSMGEIAFTSALNKRALNRIFNTKEDAEAVAKSDTEATGVEHEVKPSPDDPAKWVAVPKTRSAQGLPLQQDAQGNLSPETPEPGDLRETRLKTAESVPGFMHTAEDKILLEEKRRKNVEAFARNPLILPGGPTPPPTGKNAPTIMGKPVGQLSTNTLIYTIQSGGGKARKYAEDELARRQKEGVDPAIANTPETPADTVKRIVQTHLEAAGEEKPPAPIPTPTPAPETPSPAPQKQPEKPIPEAKKPEKAPVPPAAPKKPEQPPAAPPKADEPTIEHDGDTWRVVSTGATRADGKIFAHLASTTRGKQQRNGWNPAQVSDWIDPALLPKAKKDEGTGGAAPKVPEAPKSGTAELPKTAQTAQVAQTENNQEVKKAENQATPGDIRPHIDALIKRRAAARQMGQEKTFDKALVAAKALLAGEDVLPARFGSAAAILKGDKQIADALNALHEHAVTRQTKPTKEKKDESIPVPEAQKETAPEKVPVAVPEPVKPAKTKKPTNREILEAHFAPGNIIRSDYRREHDRVISFDWNNGSWLVKVEKVKKDKDGKWVATEPPRTHATFPDKKDAVIERGEVSQESQLSQSQTPAQQKKQADADAKKALAARKRVERDLYVLAATDLVLMEMAGTQDLAAFTQDADAKLVNEIGRIANEYAGPEQAAVLELVKDGKAVLPKEFYASAYASAKKAWEEQQKMNARDPQLYRDTLDWGMNAAQIERGGGQEAQYKEGFDHALKGKTRSTLPQEGRYGKGYDDARAWIKTEEGKAWFEGKRQEKQKSTGEALKRRWELVKKGLDDLTSADMKKAWAQIVKATTRADLFPNTLAEDATPGAKEWLDKFRGQVATFSEFYTREMIASSVQRGRYGTSAEHVFLGSHTSDRGRGKDIDWKDQDVTADMSAAREKARQAVIALYAASDAKASKDFVPDMEKRNAVINDESRWKEFANHFANGDTYKYYRDVYAYFNGIDAKKKDKARLALTRQIAQEYQQHLADLARSFEGLKTLDDIKAVIEARYGKPGDYKLGTMGADAALYHDNRNEILNLFPAKPDAWDYKYSYWTNAAGREESERPEKARKDALMRPRLDRIERKMPDDRKGRSITAAEFKKTFNFSDVTIGEYVTAKEAEDHLNYAYDALMSLSLMLGAKPHQLSFGGKMHFSIGALGHGKYPAHFSPRHPKADGTTTPVINVTKTKGDGSVLHEYFHAIDFMTTDPKLKAAIQSVKKLLIGTPKAAEEAERTARNFLAGRQIVTRGGKMTRKEMAIYALTHWYRAGGSKSTITTKFFGEAEALDNGAKDPYWSNEYEPWARAAESWGYDRLKNSGQRDDYLQSDWAADGKTTKKNYRGTPYPEGAERQRLNGFMDEFVNAIEWTDEGPRLKADHAWQKVLPFELAMKPYSDAVQHVLDNIDALEKTVQEEQRRDAEKAKADAEQRKREAMFGKTEPRPAPPPAPEPEPQPPTDSSTPEGDAPLSDDELSAIFDDVAASGNEARQEEPAAPEPGEKLDSQAWSREDVFHLLNLVMQGKMVLWSGEKFAVDNGLPTIHNVDPMHQARHMGYGVFQVSTRAYKATWTAGGAMDHTPGGKAYSVLSVEEGTYPYPKDKVIQTLNGLVGKAPSQKGEPPQKPQKPLPDLKTEQDKTAAELAAEFAKHGVKGIDKTLSGLVKLFGGGPNKLQSFPGGFDEETYAQAKVLFKEAAEEFRKSGLSFKEFVRVFFKALIDQFGNGVKPYAVKFAGEYQKTYEQVDTKPADKQDVPVGSSPSAKLADWIYGRLQAKQTTTWQELFGQADREFGGTQANGAYTPKDAYDAVELAINRTIIERGMDPSKGSPAVTMGVLESLLDLTPTQTKRTAEMDEFQQFSTPPHFALLANWVANLNAQDVYLEPSAGVGGLASFGKAAGVRQVVVNELSPRREALLQTLPFDRYFNENAEQLANILPDDVKPTVVVMNPPFSSTAGRMQGVRDTKNGAQHIEQALKLLADGGRLVAIVGEGMAADRPAFKEWWAKIQKEYNVRANIGVSGESYAKYGTTFDNQLLVIDKDGPTTGEIVTGKVDHPRDALSLLEGIRDARPQAKTTTQTSGVAGGANGGSKTQDSGSGSSANSPENTGQPGAAPVGGGGQRGAEGQGGSGVGRADGKGGKQPDGSGANTGQPGRGGRDGDTSGPGGRDDAAADSAGDSATGKRLDSAVRLDKSGNAEAGTITNSVFEPYTPKKVKIEGAVPHNTPLVESAAMAAVSPPDPTYVPNLPKNVITKGLLSDAQLESVVYAGQAHSQMLRDGQTRRGFFLGDGTGVGKGRQISGVILDNMRQGRKKAVWLSKKKELIADAKRDFEDLGGDPKQIFAQANLKTGDKVTVKEGILFAGYPGLRSRSKAEQARRKAQGGTSKPDKDGITFERVRQIVDWLGKDFDGVIVFDESHEMGNAVASQGRRGSKPTSDQAEAGLQLQAALPKARVMYVSATGATEVTNLGYAPRLGLWGEGTPFTNVQAFIAAMSRSVSAMELVAQNLKQMGLYLARSLSFEGVTYQQLTHELSPIQRDIYDELAKGWQVVLNNMEAAMEVTGQTGGGKDTGKIKSAMLSAFWSGHQRFFNQIITASQMPSILDQIEKDLTDGMAVVLQLTNTDEAGQNRAIAKAAKAREESGSEDVEEEMDLSPREQLTSLIQKAYPTLQYEQYTDSEGNRGLRPVLDSKGVQVVNKDAVRERDALIESIKSMRIPDSPLQMLMNQFGTDNIAEVTGRTQRLVKNDKGRYEIEKRGAAAVAADAQAFKDGKKQILVFSQAGGTGFSFHSDRRYKNRKKRAHYIMQAGWSADKAVQGFGRSHRTNQENEPVYRLVKTDIPGHKRFISSIARRLEQLGALTAGQRDTAGGSIFSATDNLESSYSTAAVGQFFEKLIVTRAYTQLPTDLLDQMGLAKVVNPDTGGINVSNLPTVPQFLNRLLSLRLDTQGLVFDLFMHELELQIETARRLGTFDDGLATVRHVGATVKQETEVYRDPATNADVRYIDINYKTKNEFYQFKDASELMDYHNGKKPSSANFFRNKVSGRVQMVWATDITETNKDGSIGRVCGIYRTSGRSYGQVKAENVERLTLDEAKKLWEAENAVRPETSDNPLHMVVGGILPLWDRFNEDHVKVVRIAVDDGRRFLGRQIAPKDLGDTMNKLNVKSAAAKMTGREIVKAVNEGKSVILSNGWIMKKVRVSNEARIEIDLGGKYLSMQAQNQITGSGGIYERIGWNGRYFIPTDEKRGGDAMAAIMQKTGSNAVTVKGEEEEAPPPAFSRSKPEAAPPGGFSASGLLKSQVRSVVKAVSRNWKNPPGVVILDSMAEAPTAVQAENERQKAKGAVGEPEGFTFQGKVYIIASQMATPGDVARVLLHEALGHYGLRGLFGQDLYKVLKQVAALRRRDIEAKALQYGLDMAKESDRLIAAEEVLSELAQTNPKSGLVQRAIAAIRKWIRENVPGFENMQLSDSEIIERYLVPAREFVQRGGTGVPDSLAGAFARKEFNNKQKLTELDANRELAELTRNMRQASTEAQAREAALEFVAKDPLPPNNIENLETGFIANVSQSSLNKMLHHSARNHSVSREAHFLAVANVDKFFRLATREIDPRKGFKGKKDAHIEAYHHFDIPMLYKGEILLVEMLIEQYKVPDKTGHRIYTLQSVEIGTPASQRGPRRLGFPSSSAHPPAGVGPRFTQMAAIVKGELRPDDAIDTPPPVRFSRSSPAVAIPAGGTRFPSIAPFRARMDSVINTLIYNFQDRFKPLKDIQKRAGIVPEEEDAALAEERYSGTVRARIDDFEAEMRDPLIKAIHESGVEYDDVEEYLHALHAPSRNAAMREINPTESELKDRVDALTAKRDALANDVDVAEYLKLRRELRQAQGDIEDGIADESLARAIQADIAQLKKTANVKEYADAMDELRALRLVKPFQGDNTALSGMSNAESAAVLAKIDANGTRKALERVSAIVDAITSKTRQIFIDSGLETPETIQKWNEKYEHYVPLHRDEVGGDANMPRIGQGFNIRGRESKRATGSNREVTDILAHVVAQYEAAVIRSEKTKVDQALFKFAQMHPDPALWTLDTAPMIRTVDKISGLVVNRVDPTYKDRPEVLTLKIAGQEHTISFNEKNPEGMRLAASMKNLSSQQLGAVTQMVGRGTRFLATMNTNANPVFVARNFMRDLQTAFVNLSDTELAAKKREVFADVLPAIKGMWNMAKGDKTSKWAIHAAEFKAAGGQTGWMEHYANIGERADALREDLAALQPGRTNDIKRTLKSWWDIIGDANNAVENGVRLAAYVNARKSGLTEGKAAQLAKNLTVNFNARGAKSIELNAWYMFMNASIQGSARLIKALSNKEVKKIVGWVVLTGFLMDVLARSFAGDEDEDGENDYDQLPEYVKAMNFVFWIDDRPVTIPMPYGYNAFASTGRKMSEMLFRENYSPVKSATDLVSVYLDAFSPTGQAGSALQYVAPTVADPFIQWAENKNFAGNPLRRPQNPFGVPNPEYQMGFRSTSAPAKWLAEVLNDETGGNEVRPGAININPALFDFAVTSALGGAGRTYLQATSLPLKAGGNDEIEAREVPFANIFLGAKPEFQTEKKYHDAMLSVETAKKELAEYRAKGDGEMVAQIREDHAEELSLAPFAAYTKAVLNNLRKREMALDKANPDERGALRREIEEKRRAAMAKFNQKYREAVSP